jgi:hypothetical protein
MVARRFGRDLVEEHGQANASKFWRTFNEADARRSREVALIGCKAANWSGAVLAFNCARHEAFAKEIGATGEHLRFSESKEMAEAMKRNIGAWLYEVIRGGEHGKIRNLADLVSGKEAPEIPDLSGTEKFQILDAFASLIGEHFRLPSKSELFARVNASKREKGNFPKIVKEFGLGGLPGRMPKGA